MMAAMDQVPPSAGGSKHNKNPIVIKNRQELIFMLSEAATLEHMIMCLYLYASFSLKRNVEEGVTVEQLDAIRKWDRMIIRVAEQEMLHLSLANNLLTAIGAAPHFVRPNFPLQSRYFPSHVMLALMPLDEVSLRFFLLPRATRGSIHRERPGLCKRGH
jgi:Ferritin-like